MDVHWRRSSCSAGANNCVELGSDGAIRDSKNPDGPVLRVALSDLIAAVKRGRQP